MLIENSNSVRLNHSEKKDIYISQNCNFYATTSNDLTLGFTNFEPSLFIKCLA